MIRVPGNSTIAAECYDDLRAELANPHSQVINNTIEFLAVKLSVWIVQNDRLGYLQNFAGCRELLPAKFSKVLIVARIAAIGCRLAGRKTNHAGLNPALSVAKQCASEAAGFVIRVRCDAHQSQHAVIVADVQRFAETEQLFS